MTAVHRCKRCHEPVRYVTTIHEKSQQLDPLPNPKGTVVIVAGLAMTLSKGQTHDGERWMPHAATCPKGRPQAEPKPTGLVAITGLSLIDEADRLAQKLIAKAKWLVKREPDEDDCRVAWRYFVAENPGIDPNVRDLIGPRVRHLIASRTQREEARA